MPVTLKIISSDSKQIGTCDVENYSGSEYLSALKSVNGLDESDPCYDQMSERELKYEYRKTVMDIMWRGPENDNEAKLLANISSHDWENYQNTLYDLVKNNVEFASQGDEFITIFHTYDVMGGE